MDKAVTLVTGANGEVGHILLERLAKSGRFDIIAIDIKDLDPEIKPYVLRFYKTTVTDRNSIEQIISKEKIDVIFHLAAILSTGGEKEPEKAHIVNVNGTSTLLEIANTYGRNNKKRIKFIFPSTIAVYGIPDVQTKVGTKSIKERQYNNPITMYGINKLYCENLGIYYEKYYKLLEGSNIERFIDFRSLRFPGLISAKTIPSGGTSDYAPEMIHTAAQGLSYESFVREDSSLPFMAMPDAAKALIMLSESPKENLSQNVYNVTSFSVAAKEIANIVLKVFPDTLISFNPDPNRQKIVDSWPSQIDDSQARVDWGWMPDFNLTRTFNNYLIPEITNKYKSQNKT